jgi:hypothetical protein
MPIRHSPTPIVTDRLSLLLDASNYQSIQTRSKNLIGLNEKIASNFFFASPSGTYFYDTTNEAMYFELRSYAAWGAYFQNNTEFNGTLDTSKQYTASFEWRSESEFPASNFFAEIVTYQGTSGLFAANVLSNSVDLGNGWYKFSYTFTPPNSGVNAFLRVIVGNRGTAKTKFWWRKLQVEQNSVATTWTDGSIPSSWLDLSGKNNHATNYGNQKYFYKGPVYYWDFAGITSAASSGNVSISAYQGFTFAADPVPTYGNFTFSAWIQYPGVGYGQLGFFANAGDGAGYRFGPARGGAYFLLGGVNGEGYTEGGLTYAERTSTEWFNVTAVFDREDSKIRTYINGILESTTVVPLQSTTPMPSKNPGIGRAACCGLWYGKLAHFSVYSKGLSNTEVLQNHNALKSRFGL